METEKNSFILETERVMKLCKECREKMVMKKCKSASSLSNPKVEDYLLCFADYCYNRMLDIFDDTIFLLDNNRIQAACTISRAMIETQAILLYTFDKVQSVIKKKEIKREEIIETILKSINSSRIKVTEQKRLNAGEFNLDDYGFTNQAKKRMLNMEALNTNIMDFLRKLYEYELQQGFTSDIKTQSASEQIYDLLSEWVHPSQTSLFSQYVDETHEIPTSIGMINLFDLAKFSCAQALSRICALDENYASILNLGKKLPL